MSCFIFYVENSFSWWNSLFHFFNLKNQIDWCIKHTKYFLGAPCGIHSGLLCYHKKQKNKNHWKLLLSQLLPNLCQFSRSAIISENSGDTASWLFYEKQLLSKSFSARRAYSGSQLLSWLRIHKKVRIKWFFHVYISFYWKPLTIGFEYSQLTSNIICILWGIVNSWALWTTCSERKMKSDVSQSQRFSIIVTSDLLLTWKRRRGFETKVRTEKKWFSRSSLPKVSVFAA